LYVRLRQLASATALVLALTAVPAGAAHAQSDDTGVPQAQAQSSTSRDISFDLETSVSDTLEANPGSVRMGENAILLEQGVMWSLPADGEVGTQHLSHCPSGWLCGWIHDDFQGAMMAVQQGTYADLTDWYWNQHTLEVRRCCNLSPGGTWWPVSHKITSVLNNTSLTWAPFYSHRNFENYYAYRGAPAAYVGAKWNDSFTAMCACFVEVDGDIASTH
jgi:hypothetical protein